MEGALGSVAQAKIQRLYEDLTATSVGATSDWWRAGWVVGEGSIPETENHVLTIATARYLANQLLYQRDHDLSHDNRRNGDYSVDPHRPSCTELMLFLLQYMLRADFAEYNAKPYQEETRWALLDLASFAYDAEVRLAARMVLDYLSARYATSSDDLRRLVPFRRRDEGDNVRLIPPSAQSPDLFFMDVGLLHGQPYALTPHRPTLITEPWYELRSSRARPGTPTAVEINGGPEFRSSQRHRLAQPAHTSSHRLARFQRKHWQSRG